MILSPIERAAIAYAHHLDRILPDADDITHDAILQVGELLGGLSIHGFAGDLGTALDMASVYERPHVAGAWLIDAQQCMALVEMRRAA